MALPATKREVHVPKQGEGEAPFFCLPLLLSLLREFLPVDGEADLALLLPCHAFAVASGEAFPAANTAGPPSTAD